MLDNHAIDQVIDQNMPQFRKHGVLSVRPGYLSEGGWISRKPAIVVTADEAYANLPPQQQLPKTLGGYPVDIRQASEYHKLRAANPELHAQSMAAARPEFQRPTFASERAVGGATMESMHAAIANTAAAATAAKPSIPYVPPTGVALDAIEETVTLTCHASPEAGWATLKDFLEQTTQKLTVGMYDFTSGHILETVKAAINNKTLSLVLDHPSENHTADQTDDETKQALADELGSSLKFAWALDGMDRHAAAKIFPNAYHIKVAVRDSSVFWLSSGNWNNSNQPEIDLSNHAQAVAIAKKSDRDWHVIVENSKLAKVFEKFLLNDLTVAAEHQEAEGATPEATPQAALEAMAEAEPSLPLGTPAKFFPPKTITAKIKLQPLLTPDNYSDFVIPLIQSATATFYMQTQYIHPITTPNATISKLIREVVKLIEKGVDVKLILSQWANKPWLEKIQAAGIDLSHVRNQQGVHNKGIVVDSKVVMVSSQNWSGDGVARNRDAGLIIYNEEAAKYWEEIFLHDWDHLAKQSALD